MNFCAMRGDYCSKYLLNWGFLIEDPGHVIVWKWGEEVSSFFFLLFYYHDRPRPKSTWGDKGLFRLTVYMRRVKEELKARTWK